MWVAVLSCRFAHEESQPSPMKKCIIAALLLTVTPVFAQDAQQDAVIKTNTAYSYSMLESNQDLRKVDVLLDARQGGTLTPGSIVFGTSLITIADYQKATDDSKFGYLMRHPTANNQIGDVVSEIVLHSFQVGLTGVVNSWITSYAEILYDPQQSFGAGTITSLTRNQLQLRKGFVLVGDLSKYPVYAALGKMDAPFGQTNSVSPFTNSTMWHAFGGLGYGAQIGLRTSGLNLSFMAVQGGAQFRALHAPVQGTAVPSRINNFVVDGNYARDVSEDLAVRVGASYMHGSAYCQDFPVVHFTACDDTNPASTVYGSIAWQDRVTVKGGYAITGKEWPGTHNPTPPLNVFEAQKVSSLDVGLQVRLNQEGPVRYALSGEFSNFVAGPDGAPWERQNQLIVGLSGTVSTASKLFVEVFKVDGYAPLNFVSGSNDFEPFPPGTTHSKADADSFGIVAGLHITL